VAGLDDHDVVIGIDPHKASWTAAVVDHQQQTLGTMRVPASSAGYAQLRRFSTAWPRARWAVEGATGLGLALTRLLAADGEQVLDVPPKLSARVRTLSQGHGRKNDPADAACTAIAALTGSGPRPVTVSEHTEVLRLLSDRRDDLVATRTQTVNRLHAVLVQLVAGGAPRALTVDAAAAVLRRLRPTDQPSRTRRTLASDLIADLRRVDHQLKTLDKQLRTALAASRTGLADLYGIGPILAAKILGRVGDVARFASAAHFASYCGVAPVEVSSGETVRHRLSRAGDRRLNHALHIMALTQARGDHQGQAYYLRKRADGKNRNEALRCLKRRLANVVYRQIVHDRDLAKTGPGGHPGAATKSSAADPTPTVNSSDKSLPGPVTIKATTALQPTP
jgi:transposase